MKSPPCTRSKSLGLFILAIILTVAAGWFFTDFLGKVAEKEFKLDTGLKASRTSSFLQDNLEDVTNAAKSLGPADAIVAALASGSPADLERANRLLDRIKDNFEMTICYLLDENGLTVASTDRNEKNNFVGQSFAHRPYFIGAMEGRLTTYFALGKVSRERGYFAAVPVVGNRGTITGVVVIKRNIAPVEEFFKKDPHVYLVSPEGIIFISSRKEHLYRSLWPVTEKQRRELLASGQFGSLTFAPLLETEPRTGTYVRFGNESQYVQRLPFGSEGWTLVMIEHPRIVASYRLFGMILTAVFTLLLLLFFFVLQYKNKSLEMARDLLKAKDDLQRSQKEYAQRLEFVLAGSNDATWEWDLITNQGILNKRYYEMTGYSPGEVNVDFEFFLSTIHPEDVADVQRRVQDSLDGKTNEYEAHYRMVTKSGTKNVMGRGKVVSFDEDGRPLKMAGVITDVSEMKRLGEEVNRINNLESIGLLAGGLAHDFNNVLNVIYGNISFAKMLVGGNTEIVESLTDAEVACERARELGQRLRALSLGNSPAREAISLSAFIEQVVETLFKGSDILPTIVMADDLFPVEADPRQIRQVFENLLTNAKEAMVHSGTVTVNIENYVADRKNILPIASGSYLRIAIKDSGKGIPEENLPKIFDPYFSTKDTYSQKGLGLGLSICHAILKRHNGHLVVESIAGIGTNVTVYLPASQGEAKLTVTT